MRQEERSLTIIIIDLTYIALFIILVDASQKKPSKQKHIKGGGDRRLASTDRRVLVVY